MVQPRSRLWLRQSHRCDGRGRVRPHGNGAPVAPRRSPARAAAGSADCVKRQGPDRDRASLRRALTAVLAGAALAACSPQAPAAPVVDNRAQTGLQHMPLTIHSASGVHRFKVEVARTPQEQQAGLLFRTSLAGTRGMIFPYDPPQDVAFWMKNTLIPLDMVFIRADGTIARITTAKALDETPVPGGEPVAAVAQMRGGRAFEVNIIAGQQDHSSAYYVR